MRKSIAGATCAVIHIKDVHVIALTLGNVSPRTGGAPQFDQVFCFEVGLVEHHDVPIAEAISAKKQKTFSSTSESLEVVLALGRGGRFYMWPT